MTRNTPYNFDLLLLGTVGLGTIAYIARSKLKLFNQTPKTKKLEKPPVIQERNFVKVMKEQSRRAIFFYGSQTGTAEDFACRLAKECTERYGVSAMAADIELYDLSYLDSVLPDMFVFFILATYGEGEPTDNAVEFWEFLTGESPMFSSNQDKNPLENLSYAAFGLGNKTYENFNEAIRRVDQRLTSMGATRLGERGEGDDDGTLEEDFLAWQKDMWPIFCKAMGVNENNSSKRLRQATYRLNELSLFEKGKVYLGEIGEWLEDSESAIYGSKRPYNAITTSKNLFKSDDRDCLHLEIDVSGTNLTYETGDHIAIWPINSETQVNLLARLLGLTEKLDTVIHVEAIDAAAAKKHLFPVPTTYRTVFRHYLDICAVVSRQVLISMVEYAPTEACKEALKKISEDKEIYQACVGQVNRSLGEVLVMLAETENVGLDGTFASIPIDFIIESFTRLQPRYYSISSSSKESPSVISATVVTLQYQPDMSPRKVYGVNTNYLLRIHEASHGLTYKTPEYSLNGPHDSLWDGKTARLPVHIRRSPFKLPKNSEVPIIMIGPGTGVAPFRGFIRERALQAKDSKVGPTILFFGCRNSTEDFLYKEEWPGLFETLGEKSRLITAFSRETAQKIYVQHRLMENKEEIWDLLNKGAYIYVCGDAKSMARDVNQSFVKISREVGGLDEQKAFDYVKNLRGTSRYQEDVWC